MKLTIFFAFLISACLAQEEAAAPQRPSRAPQGHIQYSDPDGLKVSWKLYAPYSQWKSHLENPQRSQRAESGTAQPTVGSHQSDLTKPAAAQEEKPIVQPVHQVQVQYKPYSMVPTHIKQLILEMYEPQGPYVDPAVYIYRAHHTQQVEEQPKQQAAVEQEESVQESSQSQYESAPTHIPKYSSKYPLNKAKIGYIQYKEEQPTPAASAAPQYGAVPERQAPERQASEPAAEEQQQQQSVIDDGMPKELHQLLNLQAQTPYHVIANRIFYKPKTIFVPKPLTDEIKGPYKYRSKVYFIKDEDLDQKNKERPEREEQKEEQSQE